MKTWKPIKGFEKYVISNLGDVKNIKTGEQVSQTLNHNNYWKVKIYGETKRYSRFVHKLMQETFELGEGQIDHIDRNPKNNDINNLRVVTNRQNNWNRNNNNKTIGVYERKRFNKKGLVTYYTSSFQFNGKMIYLGSFKTKEQAHKAYLDGLKEYGLYEEYMTIFVG